MNCINYTDVLFVTIMLLNKSISWYSERSQTLDIHQGIIYCGIESPEGLIVSCISSDFEPILSENGVEKIDTEKEHEILAIKDIKKYYRWICPNKTKFTINDFCKIIYQDMINNIDLYIDSNSRTLSELAATKGFSTNINHKLTIYLTSQTLSDKTTHCLKMKKTIAKI